MVLKAVFYLIIFIHFKTIADDVWFFKVQLWNCGHLTESVPILGLPVSVPTCCEQNALFKIQNLNEGVHKERRLKMDFVARLHLSV